MVKSCMVSEKIKMTLENIYISPLEGCNLNCKYCYTKKTKNILTNEQILDFIERYDSYLNSQNMKLKSILFCGGEVFVLKEFTDLINRLSKKNIFITVITNGTIDRLDEIEDPSNCQLLVSLDGPEEIHDKNRGIGNFKKTIKFIKHAISLGFPVEIFFLITKDSYKFKDDFDIFGLPKTYLTDRKLSLSKDEVLDIKRNYRTFPDKNFGCFQLSVQSDGNVTGCCELSKPLGKITDDPKIYVDNFVGSLKKCFNCEKCGGCSDPKFLCGYKKELGFKNCEDVIQFFS